MVLITNTNKCATQISRGAAPVLPSGIRLLAASISGLTDADKKEASRG